MIDLIVEYDVERSPQWIEKILPEQGEEDRFD